VLTETERRIAELAAAGLTNRDVAQQRFLAVKTVEANLARVYRKLGITSRAEPGAWTGPPAPESLAGLPAQVMLIEEDGWDYPVAAQPGALAARCRSALTASNRNSTTSSPGIKMLPR
jgi:Bacterial regulatory proteins, luxR family